MTPSLIKKKSIFYFWLNEKKNYNYNFTLFDLLVEEVGIHMMALKVFLQN